MKLISTFIRRISTMWFYYRGSYIKHKQKLWLETPSALLEVTTPKAADCRCRASTNLGGRKHMPFTKSFRRTLPHQSLQLVTRLQQVWEDTEIFGRTILKMFLTWVSVVIALIMSYGEWNISLQHTTLFVVIYCGKNNVDQSQPEDITLFGG